MKVIGIGMVLAGAAQALPPQFLGKSVDAASCIAGGEDFDMQLLIPAKNLSVPAIPEGGSDYSYATDNALVAVPKRCAEEFAQKIKKHSALDDRNPEGQTGAVYFYISDLEGTYDTLKSMFTCACGLVIAAHGSGGPGWSSAMFSAVFAGMDLITITPNSQAMPSSLGLKGRTPLKSIDQIDTSNFCGSYNAFDGTCSNFNKPYCYSTKVENILNAPDSYRQYVEGVYQIRKRELDYFFDNNNDLLSRFLKVFFVGNSEGGMVASRYHHVKLDESLSGRVVSAFACEFNYYMSCSDHAKICGDQCDKKVPQLNLIGDEDTYFSAAATSISSRVAAADTGYGGPITGNCRAQYNAQNFEKSTVVVLENSGHGPNYYNENVVRSVFADFFANRAVTEWKSLDSCTEAAGVYKCPLDGPITCKTVDKKYQVNPAATFNQVSNYDCSAAMPGSSSLFLFFGAWFVVMFS